MFTEDGLRITGDTGKYVTAHDQCWGDDVKITYCDRFENHPVAPGLIVYREYYATDGCGHYTKPSTQQIEVLDACKFASTGLLTNTGNFDMTIKTKPDIGSESNAVIIEVSNDDTNYEGGYNQCGDLRGIFFNLNDDPQQAYLDSLNVELIKWTGQDGLEDPTEIRFNLLCSSKGLDRVSNSVVMAGGGRKKHGKTWHCGIEVGTAGAGADNVNSVEFRLYHLDESVNVDAINTDYGFRVTSVCDENGNADKSEKVIVAPNENDCLTNDATTTVNNHECGVLPPLHEIINPSATTTNPTTGGTATSATSTTTAAATTTAATATTTATTTTCDCCDSGVAVCQSATGPSSLFQRMLK